MWLVSVYFSNMVICLSLSAFFSCEIEPGGENLGLAGEKGIRVLEISFFYVAKLRPRVSRVKPEYPKPTWPSLLALVTLRRHGGRHDLHPIAIFKTKSLPLLPWIRDANCYNSLGHNSGHCQQWRH